MVEMDRAIGSEMRNIALRVQRLIDLEGILVNMQHDLVKATQERDHLLVEVGPKTIMALQEVAADRVKENRVSDRLMLRSRD